MSKASINFNIDIPSEVINTFFDGLAKVETAKNKPVTSNSSSYFTDFLSNYAVFVPMLVSVLTKECEGKNPVSSSCHNSSVLEETISKIIEGGFRDSEVSSDSSPEEHVEKIIPITTDEEVEQETKEKPKKVPKKKVVYQDDNFTNKTLESMGVPTGPAGDFFGAVLTSFMQLPNVKTAMGDFNVQNSKPFQETNESGVTDDGVPYYQE